MNGPSAARLKLLGLLPMSLCFSPGMTWSLPCGSTGWSEPTARWQSRVAACDHPSRSPAVPVGRWAPLGGQVRLHTNTDCSLSIGREVGSEAVGISELKAGSDCAVPWAGRGVLFVRQGLPACSAGPPTRTICGATPQSWTPSPCRGNPLTLGTPLPLLCPSPPCGLCR